MGRRPRKVPPTHFPPLHYWEARLFPAVFQFVYASQGDAGWADLDFFLTAIDGFVPAVMDRIVEKFTGIYETGPSSTNGPVGDGWPPRGSSVTAKAFAAIPAGT
jgi:hypothetical protein